MYKLYQVNEYQVPAHIYIYNIPGYKYMYKYIPGIQIHRDSLIFFFWCHSYRNTHCSGGLGYR